MCVKLHIDQTLRNKNSKVQNEMVERGAVTKGNRGNKSFVERKVGECFQWIANGYCSKGKSCSFRHTRASGNRCESQGESGDAGSSRLAPKYRKTGTVYNGQKNNLPLLRRK